MPATATGGFRPAPRSGALRTFWQVGQENRIMGGIRGRVNHPLLVLDAQIDSIVTCRKASVQHETLRMTLAMKAGIAGHWWALAAISLLPISGLEAPGQPRTADRGNSWKNEAASFSLS